MKIPSTLLVKFLSSHFKIKNTNDPNEIRINSIYEDDNKHHLYINIEKGLFTDFKTNEKGSVEKLIAEYLEIPRNKILETLFKEYSNKEDFLSIFVEEKAKEEITNLEVPTGLKFFNQSSGLLRNIAFNYLKNRKLDEEVINELGYIYEPGSDYHERIFVPFYENGKLVYFITRDYKGTTKLRYKNPSGLNSKDFVYNYDKIEDELVICEGVFDAMSLSQTATALMSADIGKKQIIKIFEKGPRRIIIVPDNDETGKRTLERNLSLFFEYKPASIKIELGIYYLPNDFKDLNEMKTKTGKDFIDFTECEIYKKRKFVFNFGG